MNGEGPITVAPPGAAAAVEEVGAGEPVALRERRRAALEEALARPPPQPTDEVWRRTDPRRFDVERWPLASAGAPRAMADVPGEGALVEPFDAVLTVWPGGWSLGDRSGVVRGGALRVRPLGEVFASEPAAAGALWEVAPSVGPRDRHEFWSMALASPALVIEADDGARLERGVLVRSLAPPGVLWCPWLGVRVGAGASLHVAERLEGEGESEAFVIATVRFMVAAEGRLRLARLQRLGSGALEMDYVFGRLERDAQADLVSLQVGGRAVRSRIGAEAAATGATVRLGGLAVGVARQHVDQQTVQIHAAPDTSSDLLFKVAVRDRAHSVYRGLIGARRGAVRITALQRNHNLLLNDGARADSLPGLLIDADDLTCTHGATIGSLDPEQIHYLRSRGLSEATARRLLLEGFFEDILGRLALPALRTAARSDVRAHLAAGG